MIHWHETAQIPSSCCSSCQHPCPESSPHFMVLSAPVSTAWAMKLSQTLTERIPLLSLRGAHVLYREQQLVLVSVRSRSGFWLSLRGRSRSAQAQVTKVRAEQTCTISSILQPCQKCLPKLNEDVAQKGRERERFPLLQWLFQGIPPGYHQEVEVSLKEQVLSAASSLFCSGELLSAGCVFESTILSNAVSVRRFLCFWALQWSIHYQPGHQGVGKGCSCAFRGDPVSLRLSRSDCAVFECSREQLGDAVNGGTYTRNCFYIFWWECFPCVWIYCWINSPKKTYPRESLPVPLCLSPHMLEPDLEVKSKEPSIAHWVPFYSVKICNKAANPSSRFCLVDTFPLANGPKTTMFPSAAWCTWWVCFFLMISAPCWPSCPL